MFDKKLYWERRKSGSRGQIDLRSAPKIALWTKEDHKAGKCKKEDIGTGRISGVEMRMTKKGLEANPRRNRRYNYALPDFTKPGRNPKPKHTRNLFKRPDTQLPTKDPNKTNKQRFDERRLERQARRSGLALEPIS